MTVYDRHMHLSDAYAIKMSGLTLHSSGARKKRRAPQFKR
jgi:hypothetical protein